MNITSKLVPITLTLLVYLALPLSLNAQLKINGEFRPRTEFRNGYRYLHTTDSKPAFFTSQRTRLNLFYKGDLYQMKISAQDLRTWGDENQLKDNANVNIHEAWAELTITDRYKVKLGRQEVVYDDQRLLGSVNWTQPARSHDALIIKHESNGSDFKLDIGAVYNQENENVLGNTYTLDNYKFLSYAWTNKHFGALGISAIFLTDGFETPTGHMNYRYTYGTFVNYELQDWSAEGTFYIQNGDDDTRKNISSYMVAGKLAYQLKKIKLTTGVDYLSGGKKDDADPMRHTFNTLYATNHKFYGYMDYFLNIPKETNGGGLKDIYLNVGYNSMEEVRINVTYHHFSLANKILDPANSSQTLNKSLASELDISAAYVFTNDISLQLGYSTLFGSDSLERIQQRSSEGLQQWGWVMLVLTPEFFRY